MVTVTVYGNGVKAGSTGSGGGGTRQVSVSVPVPCWMEVFVTGKSTGRQYYKWVQSGGWGQLERDNNGDAKPPFAGYEQHKDDDKGHWYTTGCFSGNWPDPSDMDGYEKFKDRFFDAHPPKYVPDSEQPPTPSVSPELLRSVALKSLEIPKPVLDWNPKLTGRGTLVNLDTWFWLVDPPPATLTVTAAVPGSQASVTVTFDGIDINASGEEARHCDGPGTPYTAGAVRTCFLEFRRASSALGLTETPVTVAARWKGTWTANDVDQGALDPQPASITATANIRVDEVQTLVTRAR